jgi:ABC-2 type transport system permease protein
VVLFAFAVSWVFTALALVARNESAVQGVAMTGVFLFVFVSSVFVSPDTLPVPGEQRGPSLSTLAPRCHV